MARAIVEPRIAVERWPWADVLDFFAAEHKQGEHVSFEGPTGSGKTTLAVELLLARGSRRASDGRPARVTILETKRRDTTMQQLLALGWNRVTKPDQWPPSYGEEHTIVWPPKGRASSGWTAQRPLFVQVLDEIDASGSQILYIDEIADFTDYEKDGGMALGGMLSQYWRAQRSNKVSLLAGTQRPANVPRIMWDSSSWLFLWRPEDDEDVKRIAEISGDKGLTLQVLPTLGNHEFLMIRRRPSRLAVVSQVSL